LQVTAGTTMAGGVAVSQAMVQQQQTPAQLAQVRLGDILDPPKLSFAAS
jgi:hypothetical protein